MNVLPLPVSSHPALQTASLASKRALLAGLALLVGLTTGGLTAGGAAAQTTAEQALHGQVVDAATGEGIPYAAVMDVASGAAAAADAQGRFRLRLPDDRSPGDRRPVMLRARALGYLPAEALAEPGAAVRLALQSAAFAIDEIVVAGRAPVSGEIGAPRAFNATEDLLTRLPGLDLIRRGAFAWEPTVRGLQGGQIALTIDGMRVYGACVDKMDPASSYVEPENLERADVSRGAADLTVAPGLGGAINLVTARPRFGAPPAVSAETGLASGARTRFARLTAEAARGDVAVRLSASARGADDFAPGGGAPIPHSGYAKRNGALALAYRAAPRTTLTAQLLADDAWLVGYPALLMDATLAQARLASLGAEHRLAAGALEARLYRSRVDHLMDDRFRDVMARPVMRGMYMPMAGYTDTFGLVGSARLTTGPRTFRAALDAHRTEQFGDMWMYSLFPGIPDMYLLNVGQAEALNVGLALSAEQEVPSLPGAPTLRADARLDGTTRNVRREEARALFEGRGLATARRLLAPSLSVSAAGRLAPGARLQATLARTARLPTLAEHYGHYVYTYTDGFFYSGTPALGAETGSQAELRLDLAGARHEVRLAGFAQRIGRYIAGVSDEALPGGGTYQFRTWQHVGPALLWGGEGGALVRLAPGTEALATVAATFGHRYDLGESLAQMPPVRGLLAVRRSGGRAWAEAESRWALAQNRVARQAAGERPTDGYNVLALRAGYFAAPWLEVRLAAENLLDANYREHSAIGQLPSMGRSVGVSLHTRF